MQILPLAKKTATVIMSIVNSDAALMYNKAAIILDFSSRYFYWLCTRSPHALLRRPSKCLTWRKQ